MFVVYLRITFHMPASSGSLAMAINQQAEENSRPA
jgi:hypothetical protein